MEIRAVSG